MKADGVKRKYGLSVSEVVERGITCFHEAIKLGEAAYDEFYNTEGWTPNCLDFMQHLSNRYFNRAIFLLNVKDEHSQPNEIQKLGMRDLDIARDMDLEVIAYANDIGWNSNHRAGAVFNVGLVRIRGLVLLMEMGYSDDWGIEEKFEDLFDFLNDELKKQESGLFHDMDFTARRQELETEMIRYALCKGDVRIAARIAIRSLVEDEYILLSAQVQALVALMAVVDKDQSKTAASKDDLLKYLKSKCYLLKDKYDELSSESKDDGSVIMESVRASVASVFSKSMEFTSSEKREQTLTSTIFPDYLSWQIVTMEHF